MNHVPDETERALERFGEGLLYGEARPVEARLRSDLRLAVPCDEGALAVGETTARFRVDHTRREERLRDYGPYVATVVDNVEAILTGWGVEPPERYAYRETADGWHVYAGRLGL